MRAWVADADMLTEQQWMDQAESTRVFYDQMRACLTKIDRIDQALASESREDSGEDSQP